MIWTSVDVAALTALSWPDGRAEAESDGSMFSDSYCWELPQYWKGYYGLILYRGEATEAIFESGILRINFSYASGLTDDPSSENGCTFVPKNIYTVSATRSSPYSSQSEDVQLESPSVVYLRDLFPLYDEDRNQIGIYVGGSAETDLGDFSDMLVSLEYGTEETTFWTDLVRSEERS